MGIVMVITGLWQDENIMIGRRHGFVKNIF
jgi:hypothetical protein